MEEYVRTRIQGHVKICYQDTGETLVDTHNDVLFGNMSSALAHALIGNPNSFLFYLAMGNGAAYVNPTGSIGYKTSLGGAGSLVKNPTANLYNTVYVKKLTNDTHATANPNANAYISRTNLATNFEDIVVDLTLTYADPPQGSIPSANITQASIDNSNFIGQVSATGPVSAFNPDQLVFNEIGLFSGTPNLFPGDSTRTVGEVDAFVNQSVDYSRNLGTRSKLMLTHAIFHPVQKASNRAIQIIYTLRIQMGAV